DGFWVPTKDVQLWMPATLDPAWQRNRDNRGTRFGIVFGRLVRGLTIEHARAELRGVAAQLRRQYPTENADLDVNLVPLHVQVLGRRVPFMLEMLFGAVLCVLLMAGANVANLLLGRGVARRREIAVRAALGAGRRRIARQLLTESVLLSCAAGCLGLIAAAWSMRALIALAPPNIPRLDEARIDIPVLLFTLGLSVVTGVLFGLAPAVWDVPGRLRRSDAPDYAKQCPWNLREDARRLCRVPVRRGAGAARRGRTAHSQPARRAIGRFWFRRLARCHGPSPVQQRVTA